MRTTRFTNRYQQNSEERGEGSHLERRFGKSYTKEGQALLQMSSRRGTEVFFHVGRQDEQPLGACTLSCLDQSQTCRVRGLSLIYEGSDRYASEGGSEVLLVPRRVI